MTDSGIALLYDDLSRYQWWSRRLSGSGLEMHKRLLAPQRPDRPGAGCASINAWLFEQVDPPAGARVLDIGCGFGATILDWALRIPGEFVGLTLSSFQAAKASSEAGRRGLEGTCEFLVRSFDEPYDSDFDVVVSIETLLHASDLTRAVAHLAAHLRPGGRFVVVEDMGVEGASDEEADVAVLLRRWSSSHLPTVSEYRAAFAAAGLAVAAEFDLTGQLEWARDDSEARRAHLARRERRLQRLRRVLPIGRGAVDAFLGGIAMERLYAGRRLTYRAMLARREAS